jgi:hypothetical protein
MLVLAETSVAPLLGLVLTAPGATLSTTVNWYAVPLTPAKLLLPRSLTNPEATVTVYVCATCALVRLLGGVTVTTDPEIATSAVELALTVTALPLLDGVRTRLPLPRATSSLNVRTTFVLSETPLSPLLGDRLTIVGTIMSATVNE